MRENQARYTVRTMCRLLDVSTSGYYAWLHRKPSQRTQSDAALLERISQIHTRSRGTYGAPRIHAQLRTEGVCVGRKKVARLMREARLQGISRRRMTFTTRRDSTARPALDLVDRQFHADAPNKLWVADITYISIPTWQGLADLAVAHDVCCPTVVGSAMEPYLLTELVLPALSMALA